MALIFNLVLTLHGVMTLTNDIATEANDMEQI